MALAPSSSQRLPHRPPQLLLRGVGLASAGAPDAWSPPVDVGTELAWVITYRREFPEPGRCANPWLDGGDKRIVKTIGEAFDLIVHLQVALAHPGVEWLPVGTMLAERRGALQRP
jgi:phosphoribosyl-ATP pyrophosphohydrolase/phosphoribosyl-AMP cyclohydrolase